MLTESLFILTFWILGSLRKFEILGEIGDKFGEFGEKKTSEIWFFSEGIYFLQLKP